MAIQVIQEKTQTLVSKADILTTKTRHLLLDFTYLQNESAFFTKLPPEIRNIIYRFALLDGAHAHHIAEHEDGKGRRLTRIPCFPSCDEQFIRSSSAPDQNIQFREHIESSWRGGHLECKQRWMQARSNHVGRLSSPLALLQACRRMHTEAVGILYSSLIFGHPNALQAVLLTMPLDVIQRFDSIHLRWAVHDWREILVSNRKVCQAWFQDLVGYPRFRITISGGVREFTPDQILRMLSAVQTMPFEVDFFSVLSEEPQMVEITEDKDRRFAMRTIPEAPWVKLAHLLGLYDSEFPQSLDSLRSLKAMEDRWLLVQQEEILTKKRMLLCSDYS